MPPRCPRGSRRNKKTGDCEKNSQSRKSRCPKGSRRNKKTGACDPTKIVSNKKERDAQFHDIANAVTPGYEDKEMLSQEQEKTLTARVKAYLQSHPAIQYGDLIFLGSSYETRQEYGFRLVLDDGDTMAGESGLDLPLRIAPALQQRGIHYRKLLEHMQKRSDDYEEMMNDWFYGASSMEEVEGEFQEKGIL